jgi:hypothetical protein
LVQTILLATGVYFDFCKTNVGISLELVFRNEALSAWSILLLVLGVLGVAIFGLELLDQSVHVCVLLLFILKGLVGRRRRGDIVLLVKAARLDLGIEVIGVIGGICVRASRICFPHDCTVERKLCFQLPEMNR